MPPAVPVEDQRLAAGQDTAAEADLGAAQGGEAVVGGEARAGEALREERREGLGGQLAGRTTEAWVTPAGARGGGRVETGEAAGQREKKKKKKKKVKDVKGGKEDGDNESPLINDDHNTTGLILNGDWRCEALG